MPAATAPMDSRLPAFVSVKEAGLMLSIKLFEVGRLSLGQAATLAGFSKQGFIDVLAR
jgi:predicted HTH domain antitoxin